MLRRALSATACVGEVTLLTPTRGAGTGNFLSAVPLAPPDVILGLSRDYQRDPDPRKVNLAVGLYRDAAGAPLVLECVKRASASLPMDNMDYAPITGIPSFVGAAARVCFGDALYDANKERLASAQSLSGTGALRMAADFMKRYGVDVIHVPSPTYANHAGVFHAAGLQTRCYPYYSVNRHELELEQMLSYFETLPENSVVLLHGCAHNPTGFDPLPEQWEVIAEVLGDRHLIPFVDLAYQGFVSGDLERDGYVPRMLLRRGHPAFFTAQSFAKNMGLYGQRTGALHVACGSPAERTNILSQLSTIARVAYSNPPIYGAQIVDTVVRQPELRELWLSELAAMARRMAFIREQLYNALVERGVTRPIRQIKDGNGMMTLAGLSPAEVQELQETYHVYMVNSGRIALSGLTSENLDYVADSLAEVMKRERRP